MTTKAMIVAGVMSGTSADGVDVTLARISPGVDGLPRVKIIGYKGFAYPKTVREAVLRAASGDMRTVELSRLNWRLGAVYAECIDKACVSMGVKKLELVGMHGQTVYHQATAQKYAGADVRCTWQLGEAAVVRERLGCPVVSDFRPADLAAAGQGAPLVPMLDYCMFRSKTRNRVLLNLGGIANVTVIPAGARLDGVIAFDTGPANMVMDAVMQAEFGKSFDRGGKVAARGEVQKAVVAELLREKFFQALPPKSCGREEFGADFVMRFREMCTNAGAADLVATAAELTAASVIDAYGRFCWVHLGQRAPLARGTEVIAAGGGTRNMFLMHRLSKGFAELGVKLMSIDELGTESQAKEALAFALLAWLSWHGMPGNVLSATGARGPRVLGKVSFV